MVTRARTVNMHFGIGGVAPPPRPLFGASLGQAVAVAAVVTLLNASLIRSYSPGQLSSIKTYITNNGYLGQVGIHHSSKPGTVIADQSNANYANAKASLLQEFVVYPDNPNVVYLGTIHHEPENDGTTWTGATWGAAQTNWATDILPVLNNGGTFNGVVYPGRNNPIRPCPTLMGVTGTPGGGTNGATNAVWAPQSLLNMLGANNGIMAWDCYQANADQVQIAHDWMASHNNPCPWGVPELGYSVTQNSTDAVMKNTLTQVVNNAVTMDVPPFMLEQFNNNHNSIATDLAAAVVANATTFSLSNPTLLPAGSQFLFEPGTARQETVTATISSGSDYALTTGSFQFAHANNAVLYSRPNSGQYWASVSAA